jgi:hypothetical protein
MRTTVDIDKVLLDRLRAQAKDEGISFKEALNRALQRGLDPWERPEPYRCPTFSMGIPHRPLDKALALADALEEEEIGRKLALRK